MIIALYRSGGLSTGLVRASGCARTRSGARGRCRVSAWAAQEIAVKMRRNYGKIMEKQGKMVETCGNMMEK